MINMQVEDTSDTDHKELRDVMTREISVLRELLSNTREEQEVIFRNDTETLKSIMKDRDTLVTILFDCRNLRNKALKRLSPTSGIAQTIGGDLSSTAVDAIIKDDSSLGCEILSLRDQIVALLEQIKLLSERNSYLLKNKVYLTKEMIHRIYPNAENSTYSHDGTLKAKKKITVTVINREV